MVHLYQFVPATQVTDEFKEMATTWQGWDSKTHPKQEEENKFHFDYDGDYGSERVLVTSGSATVTPDDGSPAIELSAGDAVYCHFGFGATWTVHSPVEMVYGYFDKAGAEIKNEEITCDVCGDDCFEESYLFNDEEDICPKCFKADQNGAEEYDGAVYCREGKPSKEMPKSATKKRARSSVGGGSAKKGKGDYSPGADDDE